MGACVSLLIFWPVFQFQPSLTEEQIPLRHNVPMRSMKTDIWIEGIGHATVGRAAGSAPLSGDRSTSYRHKATGNPVPLGLQLMEILDSMIKHVHAWLVGGSAPRFPSYGCMNGKARLTLSTPGGALRCSALENMKISTPAKWKDSQHVPVGVIWRTLKVKLRCAPLPPPSHMWPDLHCCPTQPSRTPRSGCSSLNPALSASWLGPKALS